ncbi:MAG TPA: DUF6221 family protein [Polyangiaceae bacterium]|nr:DUF6221 family protein [Polyangiaceae bacterium]
MNSVDDLIAFVTARLDEDEHTALAASPGPWHLNEEGDTVLAVDDIAAAEAFALSGPQQRATAAHIARHDPAHVLREVAAKRAIVAYFDLCVRAESNGTAAAVLEAVMIDLASTDAHHPDFKPQWRVEHQET